MSNEALTWAFRQTAPSTGAKFVLIALADQANHEHRAWPGQSKLSAMTGQGVRTVVRHLAQLEEAGLIIRERRNAGYTHRLADGFVLPVSVAAGVPRNVDTQTPAKVTHVKMAHAKSTPVTSTHANLAPVEESPGNVGSETDAILTPVDIDTCQNGTIKEPKELTTKSKTLSATPRVTVPSSTDDPRFAAWWTAYPKKVGKADALRKYAAAIKIGVTAERLLAGAKRYRDATEKTEMRFIANPATWLHQGRWDDEISAEPAAKKPVVRDAAWYAGQGA